MVTLQKQLQDFHRIFEVLEYVNFEDVPDEVHDMRFRLLEEEFNEYKEALANRDVIEVADALADMIYIAVGTANIYGIPLNRVWDEVHRSNMDKVDKNTGLIRRRDDGKILKPEGWKGPDIKSILENHKNKQDKNTWCKNNAFDSGDSDQKSCSSNNKNSCCK